MKAFSRLFEYVWPQWPRMVTSIVCAIVVAALLAASYTTVIPLLKVMIGTEGLHPWVDHKVCSVRYGMRFFTPPHLTLARVEANSLADAAGLQSGDEITGLELSGDATPTSKITYDRLIEVLATTSMPSIDIHVLRPSSEDPNASRTLTLETTYSSDMATQLQWKPLRRFKWNTVMSLLGQTERMLTVIPRENTQANTMKAVIFIRCVAKYIQAYLAEKVVQVSITHLRQDMFIHITHLPMSYFSHERPSDTMSRIIRDTTEMSQTLKIMLGKAIREPLNTLFALAVAMYINWQLTTLFLCGGPFILIAAAKFGKIMKRATRKSLESGARMLSKLEETLAGLKVVKIYNQQVYEQQNFQFINQQLLKQQLKISRVEAATSPLLEILSIITASAAILLGAYWVMQVESAYHIDGADFLGLLVLLGASAESARKASDVWNKVQRANAAAERIFALKDKPLESEMPHAISLSPLRKCIEFKDIVFTYPGGLEPVLRGVTLQINAGDNVAIVGPNGSGKTTLASLLPRFYDPDSGQIFIDGQDIHKVTLSSLRGQMGMVTQNVVTFNDTIANNIAYGKPNASREDILDAARRAYADEFIQELPKGYNTVIGEQGLGLSGGQLQRIVIARAILKNPTILIFDEATSQVDAESEAKIHAAIETLMTDRTTLIIAHRFSTVVAADQIVVIDKGQVIAKGSHEQLMKHCQLYQNLYETQLIDA